MKHGDNTPLTQAELESIRGGISADAARATLRVDEEEVLPLVKRSTAPGQSGSSA